MKHTTDIGSVVLSLIGGSMFGCFDFPLSSASHSIWLWRLSHFERLEDRNFPTGSSECFMCVWMLKIQIVNSRGMVSPVFSG